MVSNIVLVPNLQCMYIVYYVQAFSGAYESRNYWGGGLNW